MIGRWAKEAAKKKKKNRQKRSSCRPRVFLDHLRERMIVASTSTRHEQLDHLHERANKAGKDAGRSEVSDALVNN